jgi:hypothetical protein
MSEFVQLFLLFCVEFDNIISLINTFVECISFGFYQGIESYFSILKNITTIQLRIKYKLRAINN